MRNDTDRTGMESTNNYVADLIGWILPQALLARAIRISVATDRDEYESGEPVDIVVTIANRLPIPVTIRTPRSRLWGWKVDGKLAASDERLLTRDNPESYSFRAGEVKRIERTWNGRFREASADRVEWRPPTPGTYEIEAFLATKRPQRSTTTIRILSTR